MYDSSMNSILKCGFNRMCQQKRWVLSFENIRFSLILITPLFKFSELPNAFFLLLLFCINYAPEAVLHAINPFATVLTAIRIRVSALTMLLIVLIVALVLSTILPYVGTKSMHYSVLERSLEVAPIGPLECSISTHFIVGPNASILTSIGPKVDTLSLFYSILEEAVIIATIAPYLDSFSILLLHGCHLWLWFDSFKVILDVKADVLTENAKVCVAVVLPEAFVYLFIGSGRTEHSQAHCLPIDPIALKWASILPDQLAIATLLEDIIDHGIVSLLLAKLLLLLSLALTISRSRYLAIRIHGKVSRLTHVSQRTEVECLKL